MLFLYLNTGHGHIAPAKLLHGYITQKQASGDGQNNLLKTIHPLIVHGFSKQNITQKLFYEKGYGFAIQHFPALYSVFYEVTKHRIVLKFLAWLLALKNQKHIIQLIKKYNPQKIICFHFAITPIIIKALKITKKNIPLVIVVTDPFTAHPAWFLYNNYTKTVIQYIVFSNYLKKRAEIRYGLKTVHAFSFLINPLFINNAQKNYQKSKTFRVLITGGGGGLASAIDIVKFFFKQKNNTIQVHVLCGHNKRQLNQLQAFKRKHNYDLLTIQGFTDAIYEYMCRADCIISKAGASSIFEIMALGKPLIITEYVHGQELGNVQYVIRHKKGFFIQNVVQLYQKVCEIKQTPLIHFAHDINIQNDLPLIADFILKP